jgi:hypothetical protein
MTIKRDLTLRTCTCYVVVFYLAYSSALKMEASYTSETSVEQLGWNSLNCKRLLLTWRWVLPKLPCVVRIGGLKESDKDAGSRALAVNSWISWRCCYTVRIFRAWRKQQDRLHNRNTKLPYSVSPIPNFSNEKIEIFKQNWMCQFWRFK